MIPGEHAPAEVHALAHLLNDALSNLGATAILTDPVEAEPVDQLASLTSLVSDMKAGRVDTLLILGGNPAFDAPPDLGFVEALQKVAFRARLGLYDDETSQYCPWHVNEAHELEAWGDARAFDGTVTILQPLIEPLYGGKTALEVLAAALGQPAAKGLDLLRAYWQKQHPDGFDAFFRKSLHDGFVEGSALPARALKPARTSRLRPASGRRRGRPRGRLPARSRHLRRPLREQRLAAGGSEAPHEAHVGQRRAHEPRDGARGSA